MENALTFVMFSFEKDIIGRHTYYTHNSKKPTFFRKGVQGIRRQEIDTKRLRVLKEIITHSRFPLALEISTGEYTWYIDR